MLWRSDATGTGAGVRPDTFHTLAANRRAALRDPDGRVVRARARARAGDSPLALALSYPYP